MFVILKKYNSIFNCSSVIFSNSAQVKHMPKQCSIDPLVVGINDVFDELLVTADDVWWNYLRDVCVGVPQRPQPLVDVKEVTKHALAAGSQPLANYVPEKSNNPTTDSLMYIENNRCCLISSHFLQEQTFDL